MRIIEYPGQALPGLGISECTLSSCASVLSDGVTSLMFATFSGKTMLVWLEGWESCSLGFSCSSWISVRDCFSLARKEDGADFKCSSQSLNHFHTFIART